MKNTINNWFPRAERKQRIRDDTQNSFLLTYFILHKVSFINIEPLILS